MKAQKSPYSRIELLRYSELSYKDKSLFPPYYDPKGFCDALRKIKVLALDFDGVFTDDRVVVSEEGLESVICSRTDGMGIELLRKLTDINAIVLSKEQNKVVAERCKKMQIPCTHDIEKKLEQLQQVVQEYGVNLSDVAFVGNDVNDNACLQAAGMGIAVVNAHPSTINVADYVTKARGGYGAVREVCENILHAREIDFC
ncbi:HAD hydrolase family protein [Candidatus Woesearchaeota archaeon]|nr:HAD hydrolase family protein [Candidatus Woesearchaeota archaeon]